MAALSWEEKIEKAKETAVKKAEKDGLDEQTTQKMVNEAVAKVVMAKNEAESKAAQDKSYIVKVNDNPDYCGIGAGGVQFANGQAVIKSERMAAWFREHEGYTVTEQ